MKSHNYPKFAFLHFKYFINRCVLIYLSIFKEERELEIRVERVSVRETRRIHIVHRNLNENTWDANFNF